MIWEKIYEALECVRDIELELRVQEIFDAVGFFEDGQSDFRNPEAIYLSVMNDGQTFEEFFEKINEARKTYGKYLDADVSAHLWYMQNYCMNLMKIIHQFGKDDDYPYVGTMFIYDLQAWQKSIENTIVKRMNGSKYKICSENGFAWERAKRKISKKLGKKSLLYGIMDGKKGKAYELARKGMSAEFEE